MGRDTAHGVPRSRFIRTNAGLRTPDDPREPVAIASLLALCRCTKKAADRRGELSVDGLSSVSARRRINGNQRSTEA